MDTDLKTVNLWQIFCRRCYPLKDVENEKDLSFPKYRSQGNEWFDEGHPQLNIWRKLWPKTLVTFWVDTRTYEEILWKKKARSGFLTSWSEYSPWLIKHLNNLIYFFSISKHIKYLKLNSHNWFKKETFQSKWPAGRRTSRNFWNSITNEKDRIYNLVEASKILGS